MGRREGLGRKYGLKRNNSAEKRKKKIKQEMIQRKRRKTKMKEQ